MVLQKRNRFSKNIFGEIFLNSSFFLNFEKNSGTILTKASIVYRTYL